VNHSGAHVNKERLPESQLLTLTIDLQMQWKPIFLPGVQRLVHGVVHPQHLALRINKGRAIHLLLLLCVFMACSRTKFTSNLVKWLWENTLDPFLQQALRFVFHVLAPARRYILSASEEIQKDIEKEKKEQRSVGRQQDRSRKAIFINLFVRLIFLRTLVSHTSTRKASRTKKLKRQKRRRSLFVRAKVIL
jgi:hypothetical protein